MGTKDATLIIVHQIDRHLQQPKSFAHYFSSALALCKLAEHIFKMNMNSGLTHCFLTDPPQRVLMNRFYADKLILSTGAQQGWVLSPLLFSIHRNCMTVHSSNVKLFKYTDDVALIGLGNTMPMRGLPSAWSLYCRTGVKQVNWKWMRPNQKK